MGGYEMAETDSNKGYDVDGFRARLKFFGKPSA